MCLLPLYSAGPQWQGTATPNPCFTPCLLISHGGHPAASPGAGCAGVWPPLLLPPWLCPLKQGLPRSVCFGVGGECPGLLPHWLCPKAGIKTKAGIKARRALPWPSHCIPSACCTMPVLLGLWGEMGGQGRSVFNGCEGSSSSSHSPWQHPCCAHALPGAGHATLCGSVLLQQKWGGGRGWKDPGLWVLLHCILACAHKPQPWDFPSRHTTSAVSLAVIVLNVPASAQASWGGSSSSTAAGETPGDEGRSSPCLAPFPPG